MAISPACAGELYPQDRAGVTIKQRDFLTITPEEIGFFDAVAMNPPFHMRADPACGKFLRPGPRHGLTYPQSVLR